MYKGEIINKGHHIWGSHIPDFNRSHYISDFFASIDPNKCLIYDTRAYYFSSLSVASGIIQHLSSADI